MAVANISDVCFEHIQDNYWYAAYGPFKVVMMEDSGYINASKMCTSAGKVFKEWFRNKAAKELVQAFERRHYKTSNGGIPSLVLNTEEAFKTIFTGKRTEVDCIISGTYCHPDLIPHIACWISPEFALKVGKIVNAYIVWEYKS